MSVTADDFRAIALQMPGVSEGSHRDHPDFRLNERIFATLDFPEPGWGMVTLTPGQQNAVTIAHPQCFRPANGAWGRSGSTLLLLEKADRATVTDVLHVAWENIASA